MLMKSKHPVDIMVFEEVTSDGNVTRPFTLPYGLRTNLHKVFWGYGATLDRESGCWKTLCLETGFCIVVTPAGETSLRWEKMSTTTLSLTSGRPTPQCVISLIIIYTRCCWKRDQQNSVKHKRWSKDEENGSIYQFKQRQCRKDLQEISKLLGSCSWSQWRFVCIKLIYRF